MKKRPQLKTKTLRFPRPSELAAWVAIILFVLATAIAFTGRDRLAAQEEPEAAESANITAAPVPPTVNTPSELSATDRGLYTAIFLAQRHNDFAVADRLMPQLTNQNLLGHVLAKRYLDSSYAVTNAELTQWLANYADHPDAPRLAQMAARRGLHVTLPASEKPLKGEGYSDHLGRSGMPDSWYTALGNWREHEYAQAKTIFTKLSANQELSDWHRAAAYYWAYRANDKLGNRSEAHTDLKNAAQFNTTFYGLLAAQQLGSVNINAEAPEVSDSLRNDPRAIRAALLVQLGRNDEAEDELRALYSATSTSNRTGIVTLASELGLPNLQLRLARTSGLSESEALFAQYPMPTYMVNLHPVMDSALLLAVARNESGFREVARNASSGALGMMQMLPSTARAVERQMGAQLQTASNNTDMDSIAERLSNPAMSARYGAEYLKLLAKQPAINANLIHLLVGYNAGPGTVISWKAAAGSVTDPLLYIESIPYAETRNYAMQVCAQYWIYQIMMDETPRTLAALARGQWPVLPVSKS